MDETWSVSQQALSLIKSSLFASESLAGSISLGFSLSRCGRGGGHADGIGPQPQPRGCAQQPRKPLQGKKKRAYLQSLLARAKGESREEKGTGELRQRGLLVHAAVWGSLFLESCDGV